ncbi:MAG: chorismate synthase [Candidatus Micrarchaeota archaeon]
MNTFGRMFRISIFGESHGPCVGVVIDGCPAGVHLSNDEFKSDLERRQGGVKGTTTRKEADLPMIKSGVLNGKTTGAPIMIEFQNKNVDSTTYEKIKNTPRPGHADLTGVQKFGGFNDLRGGGHFSGRLTVGLVAAGVIAKKLITPAKIDAKLIETGGTTEIERSVSTALEDGDSVGGIIECRTNGLPVGLGEPFFDSVESLISHIVFSIPAIKGIEFGAGFACANMKGSECNDEILDSSGKTRTNNAGGLNGGITNGNELLFRVAVKPTSSIKKTGKTIDLKTNEQSEISVEGRHDCCIALRMPVIIEAVTAVVLADSMMMEQKILRMMKK